MQDSGTVQPSHSIDIGPSTASVTHDQPFHSVNRTDNDPTGHVIEIIIDDCSGSVPTVSNLILCWLHLRQVHVRV